MAPDTTTTWDSELAAVPAGKFLSKDAWNALRQYVENGPTRQRGNRVVEFFKALDWLPYEEISPNPLENMAPRQQSRIRRDILRYFEHKANQRDKRREARENHKQRLIEYYRLNVSPEDKRLLERLRDYELELIGEDINWRHYFWFNSFRKVRNFISLTPLQKATLIRQFMADVHLRKRNEERIRQGTYSQFYWGDGLGDQPETFDEWLNRNQHQEFHFHRRKRPAAPEAPGHPLEAAYHHLELSPGASLSEVRQQFRKLTLQYHPDMPGGSSEAMKRILSAYQVLKQQLR